jgi:hypothetical protein
MYRSLLILFLSLFCVSLNLKSQVKDSVAARADSIAREKENRKKLYSRPRKATVLSALLPGAGQIYNRKYWKAPVVYAGLGGFGYMFYVNNSQYNDFRKGVRAAYDDDPNTTYDLRYTPEQLQAQKLYYRKYRDFALFGLGFIYLINIVDANVDAHLKTFDVSDDLSVNIRPWHALYNGNGFVSSAVGFSVKLNFK